MNTNTKLRKNALDRLRNNPEISVLVVGGGINGAGVFRELGLQGVDALLIDKSDFCAGTSAAPSRMIHGGLRYLEHGDFRLVRQSLKERNLLLENAPHFVRPLPTMIPIFDRFSGVLNTMTKFFGSGDKPGSRGAVLVKIGLLFYDFFTRKHQVMPNHKFASRKSSLESWPEINPEIVCTATYFDAWVSHPERLCLELILDTENTSSQASALNYTSLNGVEANKVLLKDELSGEIIKIEPKVVINATGAWIDFANQALDQRTRFMGGTKGSHLIIDNKELYKATNNHMLYYENPEGRVCILFSMLGKVLVGSTDIKIENPDEAKCDEAEIEYMLESVRYVFPKIKIKPSEIVFRFCGVRPLPANDSELNGAISRDHSCEIIETTEQRPYPIYSMIGGKWTTFRGFGQEVAEQVIHYLKMPHTVKTEHIPIGGGKDFPQREAERKQWIGRVQTETLIPQERLEVLLERYGSKAESVASFIMEKPDKALCFHDQYSYREIEYIFTNERVIHLDDLLLRRLTLAFQGELTSALFYEIASLAQSFYHWSNTQTKSEIQHALQILSENHGLILSENTAQQLRKEDHVSVS